MDKSSLSFSKEENTISYKLWGHKEKLFQASLKKNPNMFLSWIIVELTFLMYPLTSVVQHSPLASSYSSTI